MIKNTVFSQIGQSSNFHLYPLSSNKSIFASKYVYRSIPNGRQQMHSLFHSHIFIHSPETRFLNTLE